MKHGDFTELAESYSRYRPGYAPLIAEAFLKIGGGGDLPIADVGAGTGIWARQVAARGKRVLAIEPNDAMRQAGERQNGNLNIHWFKGSAEHTGLPDKSCELASMASSFHWPDFDAAVMEFHRIIKPGGYFMALWNTRLIETNPLLVEIENYLRNLVPELKRISSGRSDFCNTLTDRLKKCQEFDDVLYLEGRHIELQTPAHYVGLWESVNDVRVQAGEERFAKFIEHIREVTKDVPIIQAEYLTRAWMAKNA